MWLRAGMLAMLMMLTACSSLRPLPPTPPIAPEQPPAEQPAEITRTPLPPAPQPTPPVAPEVRPEPPALQPATPASTLLASVDAAIASGDLDRAAALCERALRISPRDGNLWYRLATIRFQQRRYADAAGFARRALSFSATNPQLNADSNRLLERAAAAQNAR